MIFNFFNIIYVLGNIILILTIAKFFDIFFVDKRVSDFREKQVYTILFFAVTALYLFVAIPIVTIISNLLLLFFVSTIYTNSIRKGLFSATIIIFTLASIETVIVLISTPLTVNLLESIEYEYALTVVITRVFSYVLVTFIKRIKFNSKDVDIPNKYWICLLTIPFCSIFMLFVMLTRGGVSDLFVILSVACVFISNILIFILYDRLSILFGVHYEKQVADAQAMYFEKQLATIEDALDNYRVIRHDLGNKITPLHHLVTAGKTDELLNKIAELSNICDVDKIYSNTGNNTIDSIINFKLQNAKKFNIEIGTKIYVPSDVKINTFDFSTIMGNLLDNAIEAARKTGSSWMHLDMNYRNEVLYIVIKNSFNGKVILSEDELITTKHKKENHGLGLRSAKSLLKKGNGELRIEYDSNVFTAKVLMYTD